MKNNVGFKIDLNVVYTNFVSAPRGGLGQMCNTDGTCNSPEITCVNNNGRLTCECREGYTESGSTCVASKYYTTQHYENMPFV